MVAIAVESPAILRSKLAREAMEDCNYNRVRAVALYKRWLAEEPELRAQLADSFEDDALASDIAGVDASTRRHLHRTAIQAAPDHPARRRDRPAPNPDRGAAALVAIQDRMDDDPDFHRWPMPGGGFLCDATPADVLLAARFYGQSERTMRVNRRFFELVYEAMQGGTCVGKVLPQAALKRLRRRAEEDEAGR